MKIDLNCDLGEASTHQQTKVEDVLIQLVTSANIACGFHAGDPHQIDRTIRLAKRFEVSVGAHPSYPDREGFGRKSMKLSAQEIELCVLYQLGAFAELAGRQKVRVTHVKPHGALYNDAVKDSFVAQAIVRAVLHFGRDVVLVGLANSHLIRKAKLEYLTVAAEAFADRVYNPNGTLRPRKMKGALIEDPEKAAEQALRIVRDHCVIAFDGSRVVLEAQTICIHSDTPNAVAIARAVRKSLSGAGVELAPLRPLL